jgi:hypothetical protein
MPREIKPHIRVIKLVESYRRAFLVTKQVSETTGIHDFGEGLFDNDGIDTIFTTTDGNPGKLAKILVDGLMAVPGVIGGTILKYEIDVDISAAFRPEDIYPRVLGALVKVLFPETIGDKIEVSTSMMHQNEVKKKEEKSDTGGVKCEDDDDDFEDDEPEELDITDYKKVRVDFTKGVWLSVERHFSPASISAAKKKAEAKK